MDSFGWVPIGPLCSGLLNQIDILVQRILLCVEKKHQEVISQCEYRAKCLPDGLYASLFFDRISTCTVQLWPTVAPTCDELGRLYRALECTMNPVPSVGILTRWRWHPQRGIFLSTAVASVGIGQNPTRERTRE